MSDVMQAEQAPAWVWQGFFGPMALAVAGKQAADEDARCGVWVPVQGEAPLPVDTGGAMGMFAVQTRPDAPVPVPDGMMEADSAMVGRMMGA